MKALITGASSGIGREMARILSAQGWELILCARRTALLEELAAQLPTRCSIVTADLADPNECRRLYRETRDEGIDLLVNNAGFGVYGEFTDIELDREEAMIELNIRALHILTKLFLRDFVKRDGGRILNVASSASFMPGPLMASYYATKAYVLRLSLALREELRHRKSHVTISALCPGPVDTEFNRVAGVRFCLNGLNSHDVAAYALKKTFEGKAVIVPGAVMKATHAAAKLLPETLIARFAYHFQHKKAG